MPRARGIATRAVRAAQYERLFWMRRLPIQQNAVFYESFSGNGMLCNPEAIFRALLETDDMQHLTHIWALSDLDRYESTRAEFRNNPRVRFVRTGSASYDAALSTSKYLINNATFPVTFAKRRGQLYVNTWHGTPLKKMGYDMPNGAINSRNVVRNFLNADFLLAPNDVTTNMYLDAYRMRNIFRGSIIHEGTPRIDRQFVSAEEAAAIRTRLHVDGSSVPESKKIVLYAPTWKGDFYAPTNNVRQLRNQIKSLQANLGVESYAVLLKVHQQIYEFAVQDPELRHVLVPNELPTNAALAVTDALVTDYSSIFTDFLVTERPIFFYVPDVADYQANRGTNYPVDKWPGPLSKKIDELAAQIIAATSHNSESGLGSTASTYAAARKAFCPAEDGRAASRFVDIVFRNNVAGYDVESDFSDGRDSLLIYIGGMQPNGITMSALSLLQNIDYQRFDVSAFFQHQTEQDRVALINQINPNVRVIPRVGGMLGSKFQMQALLSTRRSVRKSHAVDVDRHDRVLDDEWTRCFGSARFDYVVDFSGYSPFWPKFLLKSRARSFSLWLHNDLRADSNRKVNGRYPLRGNLEAIFQLYRRADHLVSVSRALAQVNQQKLSDYAEPAKFTYARNAIDYRRVLAQAYGLMEDEAASLEPGTRRLLIHNEIPDAPTGQDRIDLHSADLRRIVEELTNFHDIEVIYREVARRANIKKVLPPAPGTRTFVTVGRLSPEKNHARLIEAFGLVHQEYSNTRLVILGSGPLRAALDQLVTELGLGDAARLVGHQPNPFGVMAQSDCFVLSSEYEGQPMVLLEALVLGLPVITTDFASVTDALPGRCGHVVKATVGALAEGMSAFLRGDLHFDPFDYLSYNKEVTNEFYTAIGAGVRNRRSSA